VFWDELDDHARSLARTHLRAVGTPIDGPTALRPIAAFLDVRLVIRPCWDDPLFTGISLIGDDGFRLVIVNELLAPPRRAFTLAHELGHVAMEHRPPRRAMCERLANVYAAELLMPYDRLVRQVRRFGANPRILAQCNGVSLSAMRRRLEALQRQLELGGGDEDFF